MIGLYRPGGGSAPAAAEAQRDLAQGLDRGVRAETVAEDVCVQVERLTAPAKLDPERGSLTEVPGRRLDDG